MKKTFLILPVIILGGQMALADVVYVTARPQGCTVTASCPGANADGTYTEVNFPLLGDFGAVGAAVGHPQTTVARAYVSTPEYTDISGGVDLTPNLGVPGGVYRIDYNFNSTAGNTSTNVIMAVTAQNATLSFSETDKFQRQYGSPANQWQTMGYLTNNAGSATPTIQFRYQSGIVGYGAAGATGNRLLFDCWRFTSVEPCLEIPVVSVGGPLGTNSDQVIVAGVSATATAVSVYQDSGAGMVFIGTKASDVAAGNNAVTVSGLTKGAQVAATQTIDGQEGCVPTAGIMVGGFNPSLRVVLSIRETSSTGPIGTPGNTTNGNIHFLGASTRIGGAPGDGPVLTSSTSWQTLTFDRGTVVLGNASNAVGEVTGDLGYSPNDTVAVRVYAFRDVPEASTKIYSRVAAQATTLTSNDFFSVNWTWDAVPGADGYRLLRDYNLDSYTNTYTDVFTTSFLDANNQWQLLDSFTPVSPSEVQTNASVKWNFGSGSAAGTVNDLHGQWGVLDAIIFAIDDLSDTGPFDFYIDSIKNGPTVFQDFENAVGNTAEYAFRNPGLSGSTSGNLLTTPNSSRVSVRAADAGFKSLHVKFQWNGTNDTKWVRFTTSTAVGIANPQVNLDLPFTLRFLYLPAGAVPTAPPAPALNIGNNAANQQVLTWTGTHNLQAASLVTGTYTNVSGATTAPWTNTFSEPAKFFRLSNPLDF